MKIVDILLVEDNPADVDLLRETFKENKFLCNLHVVADGIEAIKFLRKQEGYRNAIRPDLVLLDLNLPLKDGREVLEEIKHDEGLKVLPVVIMTSSEAEEDILRSYQLHANAYISKPVDLESFGRIIRALEDFWFTVVSFPGGGR